MKFIKTSKIVVIMLALVLMVPAFKPSDVKAANTEDHSWAFSLSSSSTIDAYTSYRNKTDDSSVYMYTGSMSGTLSKMWVNIYGANNSYGNGSTLCNYPGRKYYVADENIARKVYNMVNEKGYSYAAIAVRGAQGNGTARGVWSPDTAGSYTEMSYE